MNFKFPDHETTKLGLQKTTVEKFRSKLAASLTDLVIINPI